MEKILTFEEIKEGWKLAVKGTGFVWVRIYDVKKKLGVTKKELENSLKKAPLEKDGILLMLSPPREVTAKSKMYTTNGLYYYAFIAFIEDKESAFSPPALKGGFPKVLTNELPTRRTKDNGKLVRNHHQKGICLPRLPALQGQTQGNVCMKSANDEILKEIRQGDAMLSNELTTKAQAHYLRSIALSNLELVKLTDRLLAKLALKNKQERR